MWYDSTPCEAAPVVPSMPAPTLAPTEMPTSAPAVLVLDECPALTFDGHEACPATSLNHACFGDLSQHGYQCNVTACVLIGDRAMWYDSTPCEAAPVVPSMPAPTLAPTEMLGNASVSLTASPTVASSIEPSPSPSQPPTFAGGIQLSIGFRFSGITSDDCKDVHFQAALIRTVATHLHRHGVRPEHITLVVKNDTQSDRRQTGGNPVQVSAQ